MDAYKIIENQIAAKYGKPTLTRKSIGDFLLEENHAVNIKSNNLQKQNYSPNIISIRAMHKWVYEERKQLSFIFVDYLDQSGELKIVKESALIPIEQISWKCLSIEAQGYGVIQKVCELELVRNQTKRTFYEGFLVAYAKYMNKEQKKHQLFSSHFIKDLETINW